jgi:2-polyprenyl-6-methoxyphenol hydroxylase-like FAD-dependent oxidoreductase
MKTSAPAPVLIAGAGPAGMATAIELAKRNIPTVVYEARAERATRGNILNILPPAIDGLARLDPSGTLIGKLTSTTKLHIDHERLNQNYDAHFSTRSFAPDTKGLAETPQELRAAVRRIDFGGADTRRYSSIPIETLENSLRDFAAQKYGNMITLVPDTAVVDYTNHNGFVEAKIASKVDGGEQVVRGAALVNAAGRALDPGEWTYDDAVASQWIGARFPVQRTPKGKLNATLTRGFRFDGPKDEFARPVVALRTGDRSLIWSRVLPTDSFRGNAAAERKFMAKQASLYGLEGTQIAGEPMLHVDMNIGVANSLVNGRVVKVGDAVRSTYFPASSGAMMGISHDAPVAADAIERMLKTGEHPSRALGRYAKSANAVTNAVFSEINSKLHDDLLPLAKTVDMNGVPITEKTPFLDGPQDVMSVVTKKNIVWTYPTSRRVPGTKLTRDWDDAIAQAKRVSAGRNTPAVIVQPVKAGAKTLEIVEAEQGGVPRDRDNGGIGWIDARVPRKPAHVQDLYGGMPSSGSRTSFAYVDDDAVVDFRHIGERFLKKHS